MAQSRAYITAAPVEPYKYGLLSAASLPPEPRKWRAGVTWQTDACTPVQVLRSDCVVGGEPTAKVPVEARPAENADPFVVSLLSNCKLVTLEEAAGSTRRRFELGAPRAIEHAFWFGDVANVPALVTGTPTVLAPTASVVTAIGRLEKALAGVYAGVGVIHTDRLVASALADRMQITGQGGAVLRTNLGTRYAFGAGYDSSVGPTGQATAAGDAWLFATGAVQVFRSEIYPEQGTQINPPTNEIFSLAEQTVLITRDCVTFAIKVTGLDV